MGSWMSSVFAGCTSQPLEQTHYYITAEELSSMKFRLAQLLTDYLVKLTMNDKNSIHYIIRERWRNGGQFSWYRPRKQPVCQVGHHGRRTSMAHFSRKELKEIWPVVVLVIYIAISIELIVWFVHQFRYDYNLARLDRMRQSANVSLSMNYSGTELPLCDKLGPQDPLCEQERDYTQQISDDYSFMKTLGNPYVKNRFWAQAGSIIALGVLYISYMHPQLVVYFEGDVGLFLVNLLLDNESEYRFCNGLIMRELRAVESSSSNYVRAAKELVNQQLHYVNQIIRASMESSAIVPDQQTPQAGPVRSRVSEIVDQHFTIKQHIRLQGHQLEARHLRDHALLRRQLKGLQANNQLHPINRTSAEWRNRLVTSFVKMALTNLVYSLVIDLFLIYFAYELVDGKPLEIVTIMDLVQLFEIWIYFDISVLACSFNIPMFLAHCENQIRYTDHLRTRIELVMVDNERDFALALREGSLDKRREQMNLKLIEVFLEYRILLGQLKQFIKSWRTAIMSGLVIMFLTPVVSRLYAPYISGPNNGIMTLFSLNTAIFADFLIVPVCHFQSKGQQLYRVLSSLLAHAIELDRQARYHFGGQRSTYMKNTVEMIRKELNEPDVMIAQFSTKIIFFKATFPKLLELHFYHSVLILAMHCKIGLWENIFGDRLKDPFSIYKNI